jgi:periplasmic mercuric ion binding protein
MKLASTIAVAAFLVVAAGGIALASDGPTTAAPAAASVSTDAKVTIPVEGLTCASCSLTVRRALKKMDGIKKVEPGAQENQALITYDPAKVKPEQMVEAINNLGFKAGTPIKG